MTYLSSIWIFIISCSNTYISLTYSTSLEVTRDEGLFSLLYQPKSIIIGAPYKSKLISLFLIRSNFNLVNYTILSKEINLK